MVYFIVLIFAPVMFMSCQKFFDGVICAEGDSDVGVFDYLRNGSFLYLRT